jgi:DNA-directed RNA polymerase beta subunit
MILFKVGNLFIKDKQYVGISQELSRRNYIDSISHIRRINKLNINNINIPEVVRSLKGSNFGYICCNETPESLDVGLTKYLALFSLITSNITFNSMEKINNFINKYNKSDNKYKIFINNNYKTLTDINFLNNFKIFRQKNYDLRYVSIYKIYNNYYINTYNGRYIRPLLKKNYYINNIIEYIDVYEFRNCKLGETHLELNSLSIVGISAAITPFLNTNQSTRITFQSGMVKQAITLNNKISYISDIKVLVYGQIPICKTLFNDLLNFNNYGINVLICVLPYKGYNQEDSLIFKKSSVEKGIFNSYRYDIQEIIIDNELFSIIINVKKGDKINNNDIVGIKYNKINNKKEKIKAKNNATFHKIIVDDFKINIIKNITIIKIIYKRYDVLNIGDKLSSRYSQKGVIGKIENDNNLPFTKKGIIPDVYINPHSFPSRMTIGHIIETVKNIDGVRNNKFVNSDGFNFEKIDNYSFYKKQSLYNGINTDVYYKVSIGYCYYQLLKHQVIEKMYAMTKGPINLITKQPINGKINNGGLRLGELDKDCLLAHGTINIIYEKFIDHSDKYKMYFCKHCYNINYQNSYCIFCEKNNLSYINTTYSFKLLCDFLKGLNINTLLFKN